MLKDLWGVACGGGVLLAATVLVPGVAAWPLVVTAWVTCVALAALPRFDRAGAS
jgi:hypothetical protein